jgi:2-dehydro-3-deoxy-D-arabinonate dehydratase
MLGKNTMKLFRTRTGAAVEFESRWYILPGADFAALSTRDDLRDHLESELTRREPADPPRRGDLLAPLAFQEVWAAGVTYFRSRTARMEEAENAGGGSFYDRVYNAERPELFLKATPHRVVGPHGSVFIRGDSKWNVPEPELAILLSPSGKILGYSVGNDMSSRDIEGENPLYLPQAKVYSASCGLGPAIYVASDPMPASTGIHLEIRRAGAVAFSDKTSLAELKRNPETLVHYLFRYNTFPQGCYLLTGTGIVPPDSFTLQPADEVSITIDSIGTLVNTVQQAN